MQARFSGTAWTQCDSWYRDERGRIVANWPGYMREYGNQTSELDRREFLFAHAARGTLDSPNGAAPAAPAELADA